MKLQHARVVLTGATGGIGQELLEQLLTAGAQVLIVGRRRSALDALAESSALSVPQNAVRTIKDFIRNSFIISKLIAKAEFAIHFFLMRNSVGVIPVFVRKNLVK